MTVSADPDGYTAPAPLVFTIGTGRCGTTMLRELLSQHSRIAFPADEMQFIPLLFETLGPTPDFTDEQTMRSLLTCVERSNFASFHMSQAGIHLQEDRFRRGITENTWPCAVNALIREFLPEPRRSDPRVLVGDKTPWYMLHMEAFAQLLPGSLFVHLVRDPRDVCLSMHKAWGTSYYRGAVRWRQHLEYFQRVVEQQNLGERCVTIHYEQLLSSPRETLTKVCSFLGLPFEEEMLSLRSGAEKWGDAAQSKEIVSSNQGKYRKSLSPDSIREIEAITWESLHRYGYVAEEASGPAPVNWSRYNLCVVPDLFRSFKVHMAEKGLIRGAGYYMEQIWSKWRTRSTRWPRGA